MSISFQITFRTFIFSLHAIWVACYVPCNESIIIRSSVPKVRSSTLHLWSHVPKRETIFSNIRTFYIYAETVKKKNIVAPKRQLWEKSQILRVLHEVLELLKWRFGNFLWRNGVYRHKLRIYLETRTQFTQHASRKWKMKDYISYCHVWLALAVHYTEQRIT